MGDPASAEAQWRLVVEEMPRYRAGWCGLGESLLAQGKVAEAGKIAQRLEGESGLGCEGMMLQSKVAAGAGDLQGARRELDQAVQAFPEDAETRQARCRLLLEHGEWEEADQARREWICVFMKEVRGQGRAERENPEAGEAGDVTLCKSALS
jgi:hypothetical protein